MDNWYWSMKPMVCSSGCIFQASLSSGDILMRIVLKQKEYNDFLPSQNQFLS